MQPSISTTHLTFKTNAERGYRQAVQMPLLQPDFASAPPLQYIVVFPLPAEPCRQFIIFGNRFQMLDNELRYLLPWIMGEAPSTGAMAAVLDRATEAGSRLQAWLAGKRRNSLMQLPKFPYLSYDF